MSECIDCRFYHGNCGNHYHDWSTDHINYEIPSESMFDGVIGDTPKCFEPSEEYQAKVNREIAENIAEYPLEVIQMAIKIKAARETGMSKSKTSPLCKAILDFINTYNSAVDSTLVKKPISYALYQTWKMWDAKEKPRIKDEKE